MVEKCKKSVDGKTFTALLTNVSKAFDCKSKCEKLLSIKIDRQLNFNPHIDKICEKLGLTLNPLSRVTPYMDVPKRRMLVNSFFLS